MLRTDKTESSFTANCLLSEAQIVDKVWKFQLRNSKLESQCLGNWVQESRRRKLGKKVHSIM